MPLDTPLPFDHSDNFKSDLERAKQEDRQRYDELTSRCEAIRQNPYKGEPKTEKMAGLYGEHVSDHWVILYQLIPNLPKHADEEDINIVYFHRYIHHKGQSDAIVRARRAERTLQFEAELGYENNGSSTISTLHDNDEVVVDTPEYRNQIYVTGTIPEDKRDNLESIIPDEDTLDFIDQSIREI